MSSWLVYPFAFILVITLLVAVHELGHYLVARWSGVRVLKFSIGFGPVLASRTDRLGTQFAVSAIPLGGYITMLDQHTREQAPQQEGAPPVAFEDLSMSWRMGILAAGPLANLLLGVFAYAAVFHMGVPQAQPIIEPTGHGLAREAASRSRPAWTPWTAGPPRRRWRCARRCWTASATPAKSISP